MFPLPSSIKKAWKDYQLGRIVRKEGSDGRDPKFKTKKWHHVDNAEFPHFIKMQVYKDKNWRASYILEVKDMKSMDWEEVTMYDGRKWKRAQVPCSYYKMKNGRTEEMEHIENISEKRE